MTISSEGATWVGAPTARVGCRSQGAVPKRRPRPKTWSSAGGFQGPPKTLRFDAEAAEALVEAGELAAGIDQPLLSAGPGRMRFRIDLQAQGVAGLAVGRARLVGSAVGHDDRDLVIIGVDAFLHRLILLTGIERFAETIT